MKKHFSIALGAVFIAAADDDDVLLWNDMEWKHATINFSKKKTV